MAVSVHERQQEALARFRARDAAGTERACLEILRESPRHPVALQLLGLVRLMSGKAGEAVSLLGQALEQRPDDPALLENLGLAHLSAGASDRAEVLFRQALAQGAAHPLLHMRLGLALDAQGRHAEAVSAMRAAAAQAPGDPDVQLNLGNVLARAGAAAEALACYEKALALQPGNAAARFNIGNLYLGMNRLEEAAAAFEEVLASVSDDADVHNNLGIVRERQGRLDAAAECYRRALALRPDHVHAHTNLGNVLRARARAEEAIACYERALAISPTHVDALVNLGIAHAEAWRHEEARTLFERVLGMEPGNLEARLNLGGLLLSQGRAREAMAQYRRALDADPRRALAHVGLGAACRQAGDLDASVDSLLKASALEPADAGIRFELAETYKVQGRLDLAIEAYERALELDPAHLPALGGLAHLRQHVCSWQGIERLWEQVRVRIAADPGEAVSPFSSLSMPLSAEEQLACARAWSRRGLAAASAARARAAFGFSGRGGRERLRIGYFSWGFHRHATAHLAAELFECHDRARFEVFAYASGPDDGSAIRARIRAACDRFSDISGEPDFEAARRIHRDGVDILVDLTGHTLGARTAILALRPAPVQVNWLGYPGTMGHDCVDYLVADPVVVPPGHERFYSERVVRLPDCYQVNDRRREVSERTPTREQCGLPAQGFVFCCFNQAYKILPDTFDLWMRILRAVPGSVLWLAEANPWMAENLRREAAARGVAAQRLVFAPRRDLPEYLVQYRLADLALDTFPYTSHTTASDALWMGCPLLTRMGDTFASRVAGSILISAGLPELVTAQPGDVERIAVELATAPEKLDAVRRKLRGNRDACPLFDTPRFARNLERAYEAMFDSFLKSGRDGGFAPGRE